MAGLADQHDIVAAPGELPGLAVHSGDQRAGRVDDLKAARLGLGLHRRTDAVRREQHGRVVGNLVQ